jgi:hypothetical protein
VIDPPFITREVWEKYAASANMLLKPQPAAPAVVAEAQTGEAASAGSSSKPCGRVLCTTIVENRCVSAAFLTSIPASCDMLHAVLSAER